MGKIIVEKIGDEELQKLNPDSWATWECEISNFDWEYPEEEVCYIFAGKVTVKTPEESVNIEAGDLVTFPKGLKCNWDVKKPIRKIYKFKY